MLSYTYNSGMVYEVTLTTLLYNKPLCNCNTERTRQMAPIKQLLEYNYNCDSITSNRNIATTATYHYNNNNNIITIL